MRVASSHASRAPRRPAAPRCIRSFRAWHTASSNERWSRVLGPPVLVGGFSRSACSRSRLSPRFAPGFPRRNAPAASMAMNAAVLVLSAKVDSRASRSARAWYRSALRRRAVAVMGPCGSQWSVVHRGERRLCERKASAQCSTRRQGPDRRNFRYGGSSQDARAARSTECFFCMSRRSSSSGRFNQISAWNGFESIGLSWTLRPSASASLTVRIAQP